MYYNFSKTDIQHNLNYWKNGIKAKTLCIYSGISSDNEPYFALYIGSIKKFKASLSKTDPKFKLVKTIPMTKFYKMPPELIWRELEIELKLLEANKDFV